MVKLYVGKGSTIATTLLLAGMALYMAWMYLNRARVNAWGRHTVLLFFWGLLLCCTAAARDGYHLSVQSAIDHTTAPGLFGALSIQTAVGAAAAVLALLCVLAVLFFHGQRARQVLFFAEAAALAVKILFMEISRVFYYCTGAAQWKF